MSRGFFGGGGLGSGRNPFAPKGKNPMAAFSRKRKKSMQELMEERSTHQVKSHKDMVSDLIDDRMFNPNKKNMSFKLPGTGSGGDENENGRSKGYMSALKVAQQKRMKDKAKRNDKKVKIVPKAFKGGKLDANGKITNSKGQVIATINPETGVIKDAMGMKVGKYKPFSFGSENKLERLVEKAASKPGFGNAKPGLGGGDHH